MVTEMVKYSVTDAEIAEMRQQYMGIMVMGPDDEDGAKLAHTARVAVKKLRCGVEQARVQFKAEALDYGRRVDAEAKRLTELLLPIEDHLAGQERIVAEEKERLKKAAEEAERQKLEAAEKEKRNAEEARLKAAHEAEEKRLQAEREKLAAERAAMDAERKRLEAEKARLAREEEERRQVAEMERARAEETARAKAEEEECRRKKEAERQRREAMLPDIEKIRAFEAQLRRLELPTVSTPEAKVFIYDVAADLSDIIDKCAAYQRA